MGGVARRAARSKKVLWNVVSGTRFIHLPAGTNYKVILSGICYKQIQTYGMPVS